MNVERKKFLIIRNAVVTIQTHYRSFYRQSKLKNAFRLGMLDPILKMHTNRRYREFFDVLIQHSSEIGMQRLKAKLKQEEERL